jgi:multidrug resistance efflux pump
MIAKSSSAGIWSRLLEPESDNWPPDVARAIARLDFAPQDQRRVAELSDKAQAGALSAEESDELDEYLHAADMLAIFQAKARTRLNRLNGSGGTM